MAAPRAQKLRQAWADRATGNKPLPDLSCLAFGTRATMHGWNCAPSSNFGTTAYHRYAYDNRLVMAAMDPVWVAAAEDMLPETHLALR